MFYYFDFKPGIEYQSMEFVTHYVRGYEASIPELTAILKTRHSRHKKNTFLFSDK